MGIEQQDGQQKQPDARGSDPSKLLPQPPATVMQALAIWSWDGMDKAAFAAVCVACM